MFYHAFDKNTLEYKGTYELLEGREPQDYFVFCEKFKEIKIPEGKKCIYALEKNQSSYKFISKKEFVELQISLGNKEPLKDTEKLDEEGNTIPKTKEELVKEGYYTKEQMLESIKAKYKLQFEEALKQGVIYKGYRFSCSDESKSRIADAVLEAQTFPEDLVSFWVSSCKVDKDGKDIENTQNARFPIKKLEDLLGLAKAIKDKWKETFFRRRSTLDSLESLSIEEIQKLFLETN